MLKHGILGLLNYGSMTGYEIMRTFKDSLNFFWTVQTSQIYRELQTLEKKEWVTYEDVKQNGRPDKKLFSITKKGKEELYRWLLEEDTGFETKSPLLMKTFFRGEMDIDENIDFFRRVKKNCDSFLLKQKEPSGKVEMYKEIIKNPEKVLYWRMTIEYGIMYMTMLQKWCDKCISKLEDIKNESISD